MAGQFQPLSGNAVSLPHPREGCELAHGPEPQCRIDRSRGSPKIAAAADASGV
jgi:hypothetical protein